ncbi:MAG: autotransporter outer membrane beta-barrel domain-containing protein [Verrucomicrobiales bacterium]|nr:autotransporter outer membrane beta-barrel domain-containing protein [Verrucomicrobiales bacterium]
MKFRLCFLARLICCYPLLIATGYSDHDPPPTLPPPTIPAGTGGLVGEVAGTAGHTVATATGSTDALLHNALARIGHLTGYQLDGLLTSLGPNDTFVFSPSVVKILEANSLPAPSAQRVGSFQGLTAATRDIGGRLMTLRTGAYLTGSRFARANEFVGDVTWIDDGTWIEIIAQADAIDLNIDDFGYAKTMDLRTYVGTLAVEYHPNRYQTFGVAGSWTETDAKLGRGLGDTQVTGAVYSVYGSWYDGPVYIDGLLAYGRMSHDIARTALNDHTAFADSESEALSAQINAGANFDCGKFVTGPIGQLEYTRSEIDPYTESGAGLFNIAVDQQQSSTLTSDLGWQIAFPVETACGFIAPHVKAGWKHQYLSNDDPVTATLVSFPANRLSAEPVELSQDYLVLGAGLVVKKAGCFDLLLDYEAEIAESYLLQAGTLSIRIPF